MISAGAIGFRAVSASVTRFSATLHPHVALFDGTTFGLYPLIVRTIERTGSWSTLPIAPGLVVSWLAFAAAMAFLLRVAQLDVDGDRAEAAVLLAAVFPFAAVFERNGAHALFLLFALGAFYAFRQQRWLMGGLYGACATATLPTGIFIVPALAWIGLGREGRGRISVLFGLCLSAGGLVMYLAYLYYLGGPPGGWEVSMARWGFQFAEAPWGALHRVFGAPHPSPVAAVNDVVALIAVALIPLVWWRLNVGYAIYMIGMLLVPMTSGRDDLLGPTCAVLFPMFVLAASIRPRVVVALIIVGSSMLYALELAFA